jgi:hypothetical protein
MNNPLAVFRRLFALASLVLLVGRLAAQPGTLALTPADSGLLGQADPGGGWGLHIPTLSFVFQVNTSIDVSALGYYFITTNGLDTGYSLTLSHWDGATLDATLATTSVGGGSSFYASSLNHDFAYAAVTPVTLLPGNTYVMSATGADVGDFFYLTSNYGPAPAIVFYENLYGSNIPTGSTSGVSNYFGPNFFFSATAVPEPATSAAWIGGLGLAAAAILRGRRTQTN